MMGSGCMGGGDTWYSVVVWYRDYRGLREVCVFFLGRCAWGWSEGVFHIGGHICKVDGWVKVFCFQVCGWGGMVWLS